MKNKKGITLVALIITIIILFILTAIVINLAFGEKGILTNAQLAGEEYKKAEIKEEVELAILDIQTKKMQNGNMIKREDLEELSLIGAIIESTGTPAFRRI